MADSALELKHFLAIAKLMPELEYTQRDKINRGYYAAKEWIANLPNLPVYSLASFAE